MKSKYVSQQRHPVSFTGYAVRMTDDLLDNATGLGYGIAVHNAKEVAEVMRFALLAPLTKRP